MKRRLFALSCGLLILALTASGFAADGQALYAKCAGCHGADGSKKALGTGIPLKGLAAAELASAMKGYKAKTFGGDKKAIMESQAAPLSVEDITALADYISRL